MNHHRGHSAGVPVGSPPLPDVGGLECTVSVYTVQHVHSVIVCEVKFDCRCVIGAVQG